MLRSLTAAVLMSTAGVALPSNAQQIDSLESLLQLSFDPSDSTAAAPQFQEITTASPSQSSPEATAALVHRTEDIVQVIAHPLDNRQAATLYVRDIPVLTFLGSELSDLSDTKAETHEAETVALEPGPAARATAIAATIDTFYQSTGDATTITARWDVEQAAYIVALGETDLVTINDETILPGTTNDMATDTLQVANRLRRLLGGADPLGAVEGQPEPVVAQPNWNVASVSTGRASWYGPGFHGRRTANGETFNQNALTAAHRTLPFGTLVRVTNLNNNRQVVVRVNDRGPYSHGRIIDLSAGAAREIGLISAGVASVQVEVLSTH
ncbi:MAG: septal ring lytic transglycosylase RlpA family protein [Cyanobacteria bacterium]|nr:septal ring lytic transglycosylase RlpA family protein [Cyanobacteriota bacterium]